MNFTRYNSRYWRAFLCIAFGMAILLSLLPISSLAASDFSYKTDITYKVEENGTARVIQQYTVTNNSSTKYLESIQLSTPTDDASNIKVRYGDGEAIEFSTSDKTTSSQGYSYDYREILIQFPRKNFGNGKKWDFSLEYTTSKIIEIKGSAKTVYVPSISQASATDEYNVTVSAPQSFGLPKSSGVKPISGGIDDGRALFTFTKEDLAKQSITLIFGDTTVYKVNFNFPLKNNSNRSKTFTITLPPDTSSQKVYINSLDPRPSGTRLDLDGNVLADYTVPPRTEITVKTDISAQVKYLEYDLKNGGNKNEIPQDIVSRYTSSTHYWQANDPDIVVKAQTAVGGNQKVVDAIKTINKIVVDTLTYNNEKIKYNYRQGASKALKEPDNAVCLEYSDLMIAMLRAQGIPARMPVGYAYSGNLKASRAVSDSLHSWVEAYVPKVGWINVDPTWGEKYDNFGRSDLDHFAFALWGAQDNAPPAVTEDGVDTNYQYEKTEISYEKEAPQADVSSKLTATKWVFLPFLSFIQYQLDAPANVAGDNYRLKITTNGSSTEVNLGSLAPSQKLSSWIMGSGSTFLATSNLQFYSADHTEQILAGMNARPNFLPLILILSFIALFVLVFLIKWAIRRKYNNKQPIVSHTQTGETTNLEQVQHQFQNELREVKRAPADDSRPPD